MKSKDKKPKRICEQLEKIGEEICDNYCRYPLLYGHGDEEMERL